MNDDALYEIHIFREPNGPSRWSGFVKRTNRDGTVTTEVTRFRIERYQVIDEAEKIIDKWQERADCEGKTAPCCECGKDYPKYELVGNGEIYCANCRKIMNRLVEERNLARDGQ